MCRGEGGAGAGEGARNLRWSRPVLAARSLLALSHFRFRFLQREPPLCVVIDMHCRHIQQPELGELAKETSGQWHRWQKESGSGCINQVLYAPLFLLKSSFHLLYINKRENIELCLFLYVSIIFFPIDQLEQLFVYFKNLLFPRDKFSICDSYLVSNIKLH